MKKIKLRIKVIEIVGEPRKQSKTAKILKQNEIDKLLSKMKLKNKIAKEIFGHEIENSKKRLEAKNG